jgi:flavodoxin I
MKPVGVFYGSSTGNTEEFAKDIANQLRERTGAQVNLINVSGIKPEQLAEYDNLIVGCPTWDVGELQSDWDRLHRKLGSLRLDGKKIAQFGCGDPVSYPDTFQDALGILGKDFRERGATLVGLWSTEGYDFEASLGVEDDQFLGLALDYDNDFKAIKAQITQWVEQISNEFD